MDNLETAESAIREARASLAAAAAAATTATTAATTPAGGWTEPMRLALDAIESVVAELSEVRDQPRENTGESGPDSSFIR